MMPTAPRPHPTGVRRWLVAFLSVLGLLLLQNTHCAAMAMPGMTGPTCALTRQTSSHPTPMRPAIKEIGTQPAILDVDALTAGSGDPIGRGTSHLASGSVDAGSFPAASAPEMVAAQVDSAMVVTVDERPAAELPAGVGLACLAVFLALLAGFAIRGVGRSAAAISLWQWPVGARARPALPRALSLAQLCVLRT
ncbi:hypothetical protein [Nocardia heshunensis]